MGYEDERRRRRSLTPLSGELRTAPVTQPRRPLRLARVVARRRRTPPPTTFRGALGLALVRLGIGVAVCAALALLVARWLGRPTAVGFYLVGAAVLALAFLFAAADTETMDSYDRGGREHRVRMSLVWVVVGATVLAIGVVLELAEY